MPGAEAGVEFASTPGRADRGQRLQSDSGVILDGPAPAERTGPCQRRPPYVYQNLLPNDGQAKKLARKRYSCSVISFFWGWTRPYETAPAAHPLPGRRLPREFRQHHPRPGPAEPTPVFTSTPRPGSTRHGPARRGHPDRHRPGRAHVRKRGAGLGLGLRDWPGGTSSAACGPWASTIWKNISNSKSFHPAFLAQALQPGQRFYARTVPQPDPVGLLPP
jgi:hypothetical protein